MKKINLTIVVLGIISICEILTTNSIQGSLFLWFGYGAYRMLSFKYF